MNQLASKTITCPYCGETIEIVIDHSIPEQEYIEDCEVCCRPINLSVYVNEDEISIYPKHENE
ncbi:MAG: CPXCG motif-containing cysteine-rich protein [Proteobacteria bacterium]|nr:CPXCG motif-containing cysteine-rich protein [Pseudomonadota bacterium]NOG61319.1 CPXCG motif-containing cysteine-rich protein [Pseudomonadota bacterium]